MNDNIGVEESLAPIGHQIRQLRRLKGWTLAEMARRTATSAPTLHRYENGWDRFKVATLQKIAAALGTRLVLRLEPVKIALENLRPPSRRALRELIAPLFWDRILENSDLEEFPAWVLSRVLMFGKPAQVAAARRYYGDEAIRQAVEKRGVDARTRGYWRFLLGETDHAPESPQR